MATRRKAVTKSRKVQKTRTNPQTGNPEVYYVTEEYTDYVTETVPDTSTSYGPSDAGSYDSGSY